MSDAWVPMFPLGRALLPGEALPLRIFEPRYLEMMEWLRTTAEVAEFGVALISHGWETGGGDQRHGTATMALVATDQEVDDMQRAVVAYGTRIVSVSEWLEDDPYPRAMVKPRLVEAVGPDDDRIASLQTGVKRLYTLASELGANVSGQSFEIPEDPTAALWHIASLIPLGEYDRLQLLECEHAEHRMATLQTLLNETIDDLKARLAEG